MLPKYFDNARMAIDLALELGATGTHSGTMGNFDKVPTDWICPGCARDKVNIARLDKNGHFYCSIHLHHDHLFDTISEKLTMDVYSSRRAHTAVKMMVRFRDEFVCMDCNRADAHMKRAVGAPSDFSFSPREIYLTVCPETRKSHFFHPDSVREIYAIAKPLHDLIAKNFECHLARDFHDIY